MTFTETGTISSNLKWNNYLLTVNRYQPTNDNELTSKIKEKIIKVMITNTDQSKNFLSKGSFF